MLVVGLTGGIGAGKSTFAALLAERGAQVVDADGLGRDALRPGRPAWHSVVAQFGEEILVPGTMGVDRKLLADIVFNDSGKLAALNAIVHPVIFSGIADSLERLRSTDAVVVLDAALLYETGLGEVVDATIAVLAPEAVRSHRLQSARGMTFDESARRMRAQMDPVELEGRADFVVRNDGSLEGLAAEADRVWAELQARPQK
jgi:dephospho-CoA kinase